MYSMLDLVLNLCIMNEYLPINSFNMLYSFITSAVDYLSTLSIGSTYSVYLLPYGSSECCYIINNVE